MARVLRIYGSVYIDDDDLTDELIAKVESALEYRIDEARQHVFDHDNIPYDVDISITIAEVKKRKAKS